MARFDPAFAGAFALGVRAGLLLRRTGVLAGCFEDVVRFEAVFAPAFADWRDVVAFPRVVFFLPGPFADAVPFRAAGPVFVDDERTTVAVEPDRADFAVVFAPDFFVVFAERVAFEVRAEPDLVEAPVALDFAADLEEDVATDFAVAFAPPFRLPADRGADDLTVALFPAALFGAAARFAFGFEEVPFFAAVLPGLLGAALAFVPGAVAFEAADFPFAAAFVAGVLDFVAPAPPVFVTFFIADSFPTLSRSFV